jgi:LysM repeat protein
MKCVIALGLALALLAMLAPGAVSAQGIGQTHVVQPGENLFRIALRYGVSIQALATINGIVNPAMIYVGQRLVIPADVAAVTSPTPTPAPATPDTTSAPITPTLEISPTVTSTQVTSPTVTPTLVTSSTVTPAPVTTPVVASLNRTHTVATGENLFRIALRYGLTTKELAVANGITNPNSVYVGQVLRIPAPGQSLGPAPAPVARVAGSGKRIVVSISRQHLWAYNGTREVYSFVASTGLATSPTKQGTFQVLDKIPNAYASQWNLQMPYWLGIYYVGRIENGIHALPILASGQRLWSGYLGRPVSFGCIVLDTLAARQLYQWADVGTLVVVQP